MIDKDVSRLVEIVATGIRVLVKRGTCQLTEDAIYDRARNIVQAVIVNFELRACPALPEGVPERIDWRTSLISEPPFRHMYGCKCGQCPIEYSTKPVGHSWSCRCDGCDTFRRSVRS